MSDTILGAKLPSFMRVEVKQETETSAKVTVYSEIHEKRNASILLRRQGDALNSPELEHFMLEEFGLTLGKKWEFKNWTDLSKDKYYAHDD